MDGGACAHQANLAPGYALRAGTSYRRLAGKPDFWRVRFPSFAPRPPRKSEGGGECPLVRNKGGGVGRRPIPGNIRIQGHSPPAPGRTQTPRFFCVDRMRTSRGGGRDSFPPPRSEEHTSELQSLMRIPYSVFCLYKKKK